MVPGQRTMTRFTTYIADFAGTFGHIPAHHLGLLEAGLWVKMDQDFQILLFHFPFSLPQAGVGL